jgi:hypothetical protein
VAGLPEEEVDTASDDPEQSLERIRREDELEERGPLYDILNFYDSYDLLPYAKHIFWLSSVKESIGFIPYELDWKDIRSLVILKEEFSKKSVKDSRDMMDKSSQGSAAGTASATPYPSATRTSVPLSKALYNAPSPPATGASTVAPGIKKSSVRNK